MADYFYQNLTDLQLQYWKDDLIKCTTISDTKMKYVKDLYNTSHSVFTESGNWEKQDDTCETLVFYFFFRLLPLGVAKVDHPPPSHPPLPLRVLVHYIRESSLWPSSFLPVCRANISFILTLHISKPSLCLSIFVSTPSVPLMCLFLILSTLVTPILGS